VPTLQVYTFEMSPCLGAYLFYLHHQVTHYSTHSTLICRNKTISLASTITFLKTRIAHTPRNLPSIIIREERSYIGGVGSKLQGLERMRVGRQTPGMEYDTDCNVFDLSCEEFDLLLVSTYNLVSARFVRPTHEAATASFLT
jgi:hypothetical protein